MGTFRNPVGPLPNAVYWRRRLIVLGVPLLVVLLIAYSCTGASGAPRNTAGAIGVSNSSSPAANVITPAPSQTQSGPPGDSFPGNGPGGAGSGGATGSAGATGTTPAGAAGGSGGATASAGTGTTAGSGGSGCVLALALALDRTSSSGPVAYPAGTFPTFKITAVDSGTANCTVDVSGRTLVVTVAAQGASAPVWSSAICSGTSDLRVLGPSDAQTFPVAWKRWESQGQTCPVSKLPTVSPGGYTVSATLDGVTAATVPFILS